MAIQEHDGYYSRNADGTHTFNGVTYTDEAFQEFISSMESTISSLEFTRGMVVNGEVTRIRGELDFVVDPAMIQRVDTLNLKLGGFDDATELQEVYRDNFYKSRAEQIDRIYQSYQVSREVTSDIHEHYIDAEGNVEADINVIGNEFDSGDGPTETDIDDVRDQNEAAAAEEDAEPGTNEA
jgi:hypothetical protein